MSKKMKLPEYDNYDLQLDIFIIFSIVLVLGLVIYKAVN